mmetsp:Transcript_19539/g.49664  ORF Transcript_19539/g.49664 Transcript_19539/m.49664 type:complete len:248 (+) Transcript_19539:1335-2078(+)
MAGFLRGSCLSTWGFRGSCFTSLSAVRRTLTGRAKVSRVVIRCTLDRLRVRKFSISRRRWFSRVSELLCVLRRSTVAGEDLWCKRSPRSPLGLRSDCLPPALDAAAGSLEEVPCASFREPLRLRSLAVTLAFWLLAGNATAVAPLPSLSLPVVRTWFTLFSERVAVCGLSTLACFVGLLFSLEAEADVSEPVAVFGVSGEEESSDGAVVSSVALPVPAGVIASALPADEQLFVLRGTPERSATASRI